MTPRTVNIVCVKSKLPCVPAVRYDGLRGWMSRAEYDATFVCSFCGARVKVTWL